MSVPDLLPRLRRRLADLGLIGRRLLVAVSGGPDSVALLDLLVRCRDEDRLTLIVAHVDHGLHPASATVADRMERWAEQLSLPCERTRLTLDSASETAARAARYRWLEAVRDRVGADWIVTAHHADDQVETVLMRFLTGSGPAGLAGMADRRGRLVRPLLPFRREELAHHVQAAGLPVWLDPANTDPRHLRSWIRTEALPFLAARLPRLEPDMLRVASQAQADRAAWNALLDGLPGLGLTTEPDGLSVVAAVLAGYDSAVATALVQALARREGFALGAVRAERALRALAGGQSGAVAQLGSGWRLERSFDRLLLRRPEAPLPQPWRLEGKDGLFDWGRWRWAWRREPAPAQQPRDGSTAWFIPGVMEVRPWQPGDRVRPLGGIGRRSVVRCLQEARIPAGRRTAWPIVAAGERIVWIPGVCRSDELVPPEGTEALRVDAANG